MVESYLDNQTPTGAMRLLLLTAQPQPLYSESLASRRRFEHHETRAEIIIQAERRWDEIAKCAHRTLGLRTGSQTRSA